MDTRSNIGSHSNNNNIAIIGIEKKVLEPWCCDLEENKINYDLNLERSDKGWDAEEMFAWNEKRFGITSDFDQKLTLYTTPLLDENGELSKAADAVIMQKKIASGNESKRYKGIRCRAKKKSKNMKSAVINGKDLTCLKNEPKTITSNLNPNASEFIYKGSL